MRKLKMSPKEFAEAMQKLEDSSLDTEACHVAADELMCNVLKERGFKDGVTTFEQMERWYA